MVYVTCLVTYEDSNLSPVHWKEALKSEPCYMVAVIVAIDLQAA